MQTLKQIKNLKGKVVLVRADFNVPIQNGKITDDFRIKKSLPTLSFLKKKGAKIVILTHLGDDGKRSTEIVAKRLSKYIPASFYDGLLENGVDNYVKKMKQGDIVVLRNIRTDEGEKKNSLSFAKKLASLADMYVNDAFSVSHRSHASVVGIPKYLPSYAGLQLEEEIKALSKVLTPKHPFIFILGGAKFDTKLPLIKKYMKVADTLFIGGALANQCFYEMGFETGLSLIEQKKFGLPKILKHKNILLPVDVLIQDHSTKTPLDISKTDNMLDVGDKTVKLLSEKIKDARLIVWNGPLGKTSLGFTTSTKKLFTAIGKSKAISIVGGGDTVEVISKMKKEKEFTFVSTGGGATIDFLAYGTLPGIKALK